MKPEHTTKTLVHRRVEQAQAGTNPYVICHVRSGWVVLGDYQFLCGYSLLLPDPVVGALDALAADARAQFLVDMPVLAAVPDVVDAPTSMRLPHCPVRVCCQSVSACLA